MYILLNKVVQYGNIFSYSVFDTDTLGVREVQNLNNVYYTNLDNYYNMDIFSCELNGSGLYILGIAKIKGNKYYIISFGSSYYFVTDKDFIIHNKTEYSNFVINKDGKIRFKNCAIPDLSDKFADTGFILVNNMFDTSVNSSGGISAKFFGRTLDNKYYGMVKFARAYNIDGSDVINEVVIYELGKLLGVSVCKAILGKVGNRQCVMSVYCYDTNKESIRSFYKESLKLGVRYNDYSSILAAHNKKFYYHFVQAMALDYITMQNDRHCKNIAIYKDDIYPLYDNGCSLQYGQEIGQYTRMELSVLRSYSLDKQLLNSVTNDKIIRLLRKYNIKQGVIDIVVKRYRQVMEGDFNGGNAIYF